MTTNEAIALFSYLADERGSPNFEDDEVIDLLNMAQLERLKRLLPDDQSPVLNFELDQNTLFNVRQLIYPVTTTMTSAGVVTFSSLNTALQTASSDNGCTVHRIVDVSWTSDGETVPVKFTKNNNWFSYKANHFKAGSATAPRYKADATNLTFDPVDVNASIRVNCMKTPKVMAAGNTPDWDTSNMNLIVEIALELASQASRDQELLGMIQNSNVSK